MELAQDMIPRNILLLSFEYLDEQLLDAIPNSLLAKWFKNSISFSKFSPPSSKQESLRALVGPKQFLSNGKNNLYNTLLKNSYLPIIWNRALASGSDAFFAKKYFNDHSDGGAAYLEQKMCAGDRIFYHLIYDERFPYQSYIERIHAFDLDACIALRRLCLHLGIRSPSAQKLVASQSEILKLLRAIRIWGRRRDRKSYQHFFLLFYSVFLARTLAFLEGSGVFEDSWIVLHANASNGNNAKNSPILSLSSNLAGIKNQSVDGAITPTSLNMILTGLACDLAANRAPDYKQLISRALLMQQKEKARPRVKQARPLSKTVPSPNADAVAKYKEKSLLLFRSIAAFPGSERV